METEYKQKKNLTRFTYETRAFQGWRLCLSREGRTFVKYFSDKKYGSSDLALEAAEQMLEDWKAILEESREKYGYLTKDCLQKIEDLVH